jgi:uncharacterized protein (TIGR00251 family)
MSNGGTDSRTAARPPWLDERAGALVLALHVQPGARRTAVVGVHGTRLKIAVACPPTEGRANAALLEFLATRLGIARASLSLLSGTSARDKRVAVRGAIDAATLLAALAPGQRP